jgi:hypothetical protein
MIGKAKDIKIKDFSSIGDYNEWVIKNKDCEIYNVTTDNLIITIVYKEKESWF